jgi:hypothetical protein
VQFRAADNSCANGLTCSKLPPGVENSTRLFTGIHCEEVLYGPIQPLAELYGGCIMVLKVS